MLHQDRLLGLGLLFFCSLGWFWLIPFYVEGDAPQLYPRCILVFISLSSFGLCLRPSPNITKKCGEGMSAKRAAHVRATLKMLVLMVGYLTYLLLIPLLGFFTCSAVAVIFFLYFLGVRGFRSLILAPSILLLSVYLIIERGLRFDLPNGLLF